MLYKTFAISKRTLKLGTIDFDVVECETQEIQTTMYYWMDLPGSRRSIIMNDGTMF